MDSSALIPSGYKFLPTDKELVGHYLFNKRTRALNPHPMEALLIPECDLYGEEEPWQIFQRFGPRQQQLYGRGVTDLYFFTKLKKKGSKYDRSIGAGCWHGEDSGKKVVVCRSFGIEGEKKRFSYRNKGSRHNCGWILHEFCMKGSGRETDPWVLCRVRMNTKGKKRELDAVD